MATLQVTVPDALVPRLIAAIQFRYPDVTGTNAQIGREGVRRLLKETLVAAETRTAEVNGEAQTVAAAQAARTQASTDGDTIT